MVYIFADTSPLTTVSQHWYASSHHSYMLQLDWLVVYLPVKTEAVKEIERRGTNIPASRIPVHHEDPSDGAASYVPRAAHD